MDRSKQLAFPIHPTNTSSVCIELAGGIRICCIGRKLKRCRYGLELHVAMPAFVRTLTEPSIFASARIEWLSCGSRITALGSSPRPTASRSRRKRRRINDDATIARPEILLAAVGNPALSHSTTYPRSASLTSRRGSRPIPRFLTRNRKFESISLQRRVNCEPDFRAHPISGTKRAGARRSSPMPLTRRPDGVPARASVRGGKLFCPCPRRRAEAASEIPRSACRG